MKNFRVTYLSGQSLIMSGENVEAVAKLAYEGIAKFMVGRPHVGIASVVEVTA